MDRPGRRTFIVACAFLMLTGALQLYGYLTWRSSDPVLLAIDASLRAYRMPLGFGLAPSLMDLQQSLSLTTSVALLWLGVLGIAIATSDASRALLRTMTFVNLAGVAALMFVYARFRIPPPFVSIALVEVMLALSLIRQALGLAK